MAKKDEHMYGLEKEADRDGNRVTAVIDGFKGVDADVPKTKRTTGPDGLPKLERVMTRMSPPKSGSMRVRTSANDPEIADATALYKLARSMFYFSPVSEKDQAEKDMNIAFWKMQLVRFQQKLAKYEANPARMGHADVEPKQRRVYRIKIAEAREELRDLGVEV